MPTTSQIAVQEIDWSGFLQRPISPFSPADWSAHVEGKTVLITGAGGSIGSALALLLMTAGPQHKLVLLDHSRDSLDFLYKRYKQQQVTLPDVSFIEADILDHPQLDQLFGSHQPQIIFHAAALKHLVPLESNVFPALEINTLGTVDLLLKSLHFNVEQFVNISTDKAVKPTSVLGISKRIAELFLLACNPAGPQVKSVRLGNVLGSSGSVAAIFLQRLHEQLPLEITHHEASRYFLTLPEGASVLLNALALKNTALLLPEMGAPRKIVELANFLQCSFDIEASKRQMVFLGLRDGEKLCEHLIYGFERLRSTRMERIYEVCNPAVESHVMQELVQLRKLIKAHQKSGLLELLLQLVPEFQPSSTLIQCLS